MIGGFCYYLGNYEINVLLITYLQQYKVSHFFILSAVKG